MVYNSYNFNMKYSKPFVVLEIGCNHKGDVSIAENLIREAASVGVQAVKFQKRNIYECLTEEERNAPHPDPKNSYGRTYGEHRAFLEFDIEVHKHLKELSESLGLIYSSSVFDITSAREVASLEPAYIKVASAQNNNEDMLKWLCDNFAGEIQVSLGMTTRKEEEALINLFYARRRISDLTLLACTSGYPVASEDACILEVSRIKHTYGNIVKRIGISGHYISTAIDVAAYALGAEVIERHFTHNKSWKGTDHIASLEISDVKTLMQDLGEVYKALKFKADEIIPAENESRKKLKFGR